MLEEISKNIISAMPTVSTGCFVVAGAVAGRKVMSAGVCKAGATALGLMGNPKAAEWNKSSHDYLTQAKKDAFSDLTKAAGFALAGFGAKYAGEALKEIPMPKPDPSTLDGLKFGLGVLGGGLLVTGLFLSCLCIKLPELMGNT
jgi:hypothetical protein